MGSKGMAHRMLSSQLSAELTAANEERLKLRNELATSDERLDAALNAIERLQKQLRGPPGRRMLDEDDDDAAPRAPPKRVIQPAKRAVARKRVNTQPVMARQSAAYYESESEDDLPNPKAEPKTAAKTKKRARESAPQHCAAVSSRQTQNPDSYEQPNSHQYQYPKRLKLNFGKPPPTPTEPTSNPYSLTPASAKRHPKPLLPTLAETRDFKFTFIIAYDSPTKETFSYYHSTDFSPTEDLTDVFDLIASLKDTWEAAAGAEWRYEFTQRKFKNRKRVCVSTKLAKRRTYWRRGDDGFFACRECAGMGRPCFTWEKGEFWCLPLHEEDRRVPVEKEKEVRYWINERDEHEIIRREEKQGGKICGKGGEESEEEDEEEANASYESDEDSEVSDDALEYASDDELCE